MSRRALLALSLLAAPLRAQNPEDRGVGELRALTSGLDSQLAIVAAVRARREAATVPQRSARLVEHGDIALVVWSAVPNEAAQRLAERADSLLRASGVVPASFTRGVVLVANETADTAVVLARPALKSRRRIPVYIPAESVRLQRLDDWWILGPLLTAYTNTLDTAWAPWVRNAWGFVRWPRERAPEWAARELLAPVYATGGACLSGSTAGCRRFLGLDGDEHPYAVRFTPSEVRHLLANYYGGYQGAAACRTGDDAACLQLIERYDFTGTGAVPASGDTRAGLLAAVVALHGPRAAQAALMDVRGPVGERLARATGISEDSLMLEWRAWALSAGHQRHTQAGFTDLLPVVGAVALLLYLSTRSGRWT